MSRVTKLTLSQAERLIAEHGAVVPASAVSEISEQPATHPAQTPAAVPSPTPKTAAGAPSLNASPECLAILNARLPLEKRIAYAREQIRFYDTCSGEFAAQELAFNRTLLTDSVNALAAFDVERLTDEARERLARVGGAFIKHPMQAAQRTA